MRDGAGIGLIDVTRREPSSFTKGDVALLESFANQTVIAIENARLLSELQEKNESRTEAREQQTVTSEILAVISSSPTDVTPVFNAIVALSVLFGRQTRTFDAPRVPDVPPHHRCGHASPV